MSSPPGPFPSSGRRAPLPETAAGTSPDAPWPVRVVSMKLDGYLAKTPAMWIEGQLVDVKVRPGAATAFATLRDPDVDMSLPVSFHVRVLHACEGLQDGTRVVVRGKPEFWTKRGQLQMQLVQIRMVGVGELLARIEGLKRSLAAEGLFDQGRKKPLPFLPRRVGLVCGRASAAERDVLVTARTRWPAVRFEIREVAVQGSEAVTAVVGALRELDQHPEVDVIVLARGGGSLEDLLPFSDESLVRAVAGCSTPVVAAIGHEVDTPLVDLAADVRASTPTDAGRRVVPDLAAERAGLAATRRRLRHTADNALAQQRQLLATLRAHPVLARPTVIVDTQTELVHRLRRQAHTAAVRRVERVQAELSRLSATVRALSPQATLDRGYAVVRLPDGRVLLDPADAAPRARLQVRLAAGTLTARREPDERKEASR